MRVCVQVWSNGEQTDLDVETTGRDLGQGRAGGSEQQVIEQPRSTPGDEVELLRHGEDDMKVRNREQLGVSCLDPCRASGTLTARTGATSTGMPLNVLEPTVVALLPLATEGRRSALRDGSQRFPLSCCRGMGRQERSTARSDDRAEIMLGAHGRQSTGWMRVST